jgi:hypothetical protein
MAGIWKRGKNVEKWDFFQLVEYVETGKRAYVYAFPFSLHSREGLND